MKFRLIQVLCVASALTQIGAPQLCSAADSAKTEQSSDPVALRPGEGLLPDALLSLNADERAYHFSRYALLTDKTCRTLTVWENDGDKIKLVDAFPADMGRQTGDKASEGDYKTPEGIYFFQNTMDGAKVDFSKYGVRIFTMDYPNYFDRLEKKTGTGIWLHAVPDTTSLQRGSRGCVVVRNKVIEDIKKYIELQRTPIVVVNEVAYLQPKDWLDQQKKMMDWLDTWRAAWASKDIDRYMALYSEKFHANGMNKDRWRKYKQNLNDRYKFIDVALRNVQIFNEGPKVVIRFLQEYNSDLKKDVGAKIIYALKNPTGYEIVGENWVPVDYTPPSPAAAPTAGRAAAE
jgi:murein L,D-transpeptidase YafK